MKTLVPITERNENRRMREPVADNSKKAVYLIDGKAFDTLEGLYRIIGRDWLSRATWGSNLDALNDIFRGGFGLPEGGFTIRWVNSDVSRARLGYPETIRQLTKRLSRCHLSNVDAVKTQLETAKSGRGPTVFDWVVELIRDHGPGGDQPEDGIELLLE